MRYLSVCSGIEAATVAWHHLGWSPVAFSEIEKFPSAVLAHHYPTVPNLGDMTKFKEWPNDQINLLVGGTPCQSFSVAGLRKGMDDPRGNLALTYLAIADKYRPRWLVWENVPGVLSSNGGRDFGSFLGAMGQLGYGFAYRVLDAYHFGCPVPRPRVFVVGYLGDWRRASAVLFERETFEASAEGSASGPRPHTLSTQNTGSRNARGNIICDGGVWRGMSPRETERALGFPDDYTQIAITGPEAALEPRVTLRDDARGIRRDADKAARGLRALQPRNEAPSSGPLPSDGPRSRNTLSSLQHQTSGSGGYGLVNAGLGIPRGRRGIDGPRYKALGNSMAVPVMRWIGQRIDHIERTYP